jgi:tetratricopeptide (TPR) repeat protein
MFDWAEELNHPISTCVAHLCALKLEYNLQDMDAIGEHSDAIRQLAEEYRFPWYLAFGDLFDTWHKAMEVSNAKDINEALEALVHIYNERISRDGTLLIHSQFSRMITEFLIRKNQWQDALEWVDKGIQVARTHKEFIYLAELLRMKAQSLLLKGDLGATLEQLKESINLAKKKGHRLFELRARVSLCQAIRVHEEPFKEAVLQLKPLVNTFPVGSDYADLKSARELL